MIGKIDIFNEDKLKLVKEYSIAVLQGNPELSWTVPEIISYSFDIAEAMVEEYEKRYGKG